MIRSRIIIYRRSRIMNRQLEINTLGPQGSLLLAQRAEELRRSNRSYTVSAPRYSGMAVAKL